MITTKDKINFCSLPTPMLKTSEIIPNNNLYIKRDDMTGFACGGNKTRKIEYFMHDAVSKNCDYIVSYGSVQSNLCTAVAAASAKLNMPCKLILSNSEDKSLQGNYFLFLLYGAETVFSKVENVKITISKTLIELKEKGYNPYFIEGGGHGNLGTHSYVQAYNEILMQSNNSSVKFDYIFHASGTGTTQSGLIIGNILSGETSKIIGISVARKKARGIEVISQSIKDYLEDYFPKLKIQLNNDQIIFIDDYIGKSYGDAYPEIIETIVDFSKKTGILLDPTYTGKAFLGMMDFIKTNNITDKNILFLHTGGLPILFAKTNLFKDLL